MITNVFKKYTPVNFLLLLFLSFLSVVIYQIFNVNWEFNTIFILEKICGILLILISITFVNFKENINKLNKNSEYTTLILFFFLLLFPTVSTNLYIIVANLLILIAFHNLLSLQRATAKTDEKIFDASLLILVASFFHFWTILFLFLVFVSIFRHDRKNFRKWMLPLVALLAVSILFLLYCLFFGINVIAVLQKSAAVSFQLSHFSNYLQNISFSLYASISIFFLLSLYLSIHKYSQDLIVSIRKIIVSFFIGVIIFFISANKSNDLLIFTFIPLSMLATFELEQDSSNIKKEIILYSIMLFSLVLFFLQLCNWF